MDPEVIRGNLAKADRELADLKLAMIESATRYAFQGSLDEIAKEQMSWCKKLDAARNLMFGAYTEAR